MVKWSEKELFRPGGAIRDTHRTAFGGREGQFLTALKALAVETSTLVIYGQAGIGKTSFAWQVKSIASSGSLRGTVAGNLVDTVGDDSFLSLSVAWLQCRPDMQTLTGVLLALLQRGTGGDTTLPDLAPDVFNDKDIVDAVERIAEINFRLFKIGSKVVKGKKGSPRIEERLNAEQQAFSLFYRCLSDTKRKLNRDILIFLDEIDVVASGKAVQVGGLVKACNDARFAFICSEDSLPRLFADHTSSERKIEEIGIPALTEGEVTQILNAIESLTKQRGSAIHFSADYRFELYKLSGGYPEVIQSIGFETALLLRARSKVDADLRVLSEVFEELYGAGKRATKMARIRESVGKYAMREMILKTLASQPQGWFDESKLKDELGDDLKGYDNHMLALCRDKIIDRDSSGEQVRFSSPVYKLIIESALKVGRRLGKAQ